jgi:hypothetical protein
MAQAGSNQNTTENEFTSVTFDSFSNETVSKYNANTSFVLDNIAFYMMSIERIQSAGAGEDDEPFDSSRFIVSAQTENSSHDVALDRWSSIIMNSITFNCDQENIVIEESWSNTPEVIDDYPNIDHNLYRSFNSCLFLISEEQLKKIVTCTEFEVRVSTNYTHIDLDDNEETILLNALRVFYHEVYDKETLSGEIIDSAINEERERTKVFKENVQAAEEAGGCFVATAVYGSHDHFNLIVLRSFRDNFLRQYSMGRAFIAFYYEHGPKLANKVKESSFLKAIFTPLVETGVRIVRVFKLG